MHARTPALTQMVKQCLTECSFKTTHSWSWTAQVMHVQSCKEWEPVSRVLTHMELLPGKCMVMVRGIEAQRLGRRLMNQQQRMSNYNQLVQLGYKSLSVSYMICISLQQLLVYTSTIFGLPLAVACGADQGGNGDRSDTMQGMFMSSLKVLHQRRRSSSTDNPRYDC